MPKGVITNVQLAKRLRIPYFRSIFMRTTYQQGECIEMRAVS